MKYDSVKGQYWFRQSWVGDFLMCPERARRSAFHPPEDDGMDGTDATALGTAAHSIIESFMFGRAWEDAVHEGRDELQRRINARDFKVVGIKTGTTMIKYLNSCATAFLTDVYPHVEDPDPERGIEHHFKHQFDPKWGFTGTWDYLDDEGTLWDWKTAGGNFATQYGPKALSKKIQPTVYTAVVAEWTTGHSNTARYPFKYGIMEKGPTPKGHTRQTERHDGHWRFLQRQIEGIIKLYETYGPDEEWPMIDNEWHCSSDWCDHWFDCKGKTVQITTTKESL